MRFDFSYIENDLHSLELMDSRFKPRPLGVIVAFCTSDNCAKKSRRNDNVYTKYGTIKNVPRSAIDCPDCKSALYWQRDIEVRDMKRKRRNA